MAKKALTEAQLARRRAVVSKAKAAAEAAGKNWAALKPEERKAFRMEARKALRQAKQAKQD